MAVYVSRLFRGHAERVMALFRDGRVALHGAQERQVPSRIAISVRGHDIRFSDTVDTDVARLAVPWLAPDQRAEQARRLQLAVG